MSHDIFLYTSNLSDRFEERTNPFTGEVSQQPVDESVTGGERESLIALFEGCKTDGPDEIGAYTLKLADESEIEVYFFGLDEEGGCNSGYFALRDCSPAIARCVYAVAEAGNLVIQIAPDGEYVCPSKRIAERVADRWPGVGVVESSDELYQLMLPGFKAWETYKGDVADELDGDLPGLL